MEKFNPTRIYDSLLEDTSATKEEAQKITTEVVRLLMLIRGVYRFSNLTGRVLVSSITSDSLSESGLPPDVYQYEVVAWNGYEESEPSEPFIVEVPPDWTPVVVAGTGGGILVVGFLFQRRRRKMSRPIPN